MAPSRLQRNFRFLSLFYFAVGLFCVVFLKTISPYAMRFFTDTPVSGPREILIKIQNKNALERLIAFDHGTWGFVDRKSFFLANHASWHRVKLERASTIQNWLSMAKTLPGVAAVETNQTYHHANSTDHDVKIDPIIEEPPHPTLDGNKKNLTMYTLAALRKIHLFEAWKITRGDKQTIVADLDTGVDYNHRNLMPAVWRNPGEIPENGIDDDGNGFVDDEVGWDFKDNDARPYDDNNHGTHTAGIIAAASSNGISGIAPETSLMIVRFLGGKSGIGTTIDAIRAVNYAVANGASILNNSWNGGEHSQALEDCIREAGKKGVLFVTSAGNLAGNNDTNRPYPASYALDNILSVGATDTHDQLAPFSNFGMHTVHLAAPGKAILSTIPQGYARLSGTSMAAPQVSGAAALLKSAYPELSGQEIRELILNSVDKIPDLQDKVASQGRLNIARAFQLARESYGPPIYRNSL